MVLVIKEECIILYSHLWSILLRVPYTSSKYLLYYIPWYNLTPHNCLEFKLPGDGELTYLTVRTVMRPPLFISRPTAIASRNLWVKWSFSTLFTKRFFFSPACIQTAKCCIIFTAMIYERTDDDFQYLDKNYRILAIIFLIKLLVALSIDQSCM